VKVLFGFDALKKPEEVQRAEEEAKAKADENRINKRRIRALIKPKKAATANSNEPLKSKSGGIIWRAEFLRALQETKGDRPVNEEGSVLHALSSDAEFEQYFRPLMTAYSKWVIEYNIAQLLQMDEYLPKFFKIISKTKKNLKEYQVEKLKRDMNLVNYKNFLINNIEDQVDYPLSAQQRLDLRARDLDDKIAQVNQRKDQLQEAHR
jgi:hypothetical protein